MRRKPRPQKPDLRAQWQIDQGARCGCRGTDDMCPCQNENPYPAPRRDYEAEVRTLELQQQTDRQTISSLLSDNAALAERVGVLESIVRKIVSADNEMRSDNRKMGGLADAVDNFGQAYQSQFLGDALAEARAALHQPEAVQSEEGGVG